MLVQSADALAVVGVHPSGEQLDQHGSVKPVDAGREGHRFETLTGCVQQVSADDELPHETPGALRVDAQLGFEERLEFSRNHRYQHAEAPWYLVVLVAWY